MNEKKYKVIMRKKVTKSRRFAMGLVEHYEGFVIDVIASGLDFVTAKALRKHNRKFEIVPDRKDKKR